MEKKNLKNILKRKNFFSCLLFNKRFEKKSLREREKGKIKNNVNDDLIEY